MTAVDISLMERNRLLAEINSWDDWYRIEQTVFKIDQWPELGIDEIEKMLSRKPKAHSGTEWESTASNYAVERDLEYEYEKLRQMVFEKLEPESARENMNHPEWYGKQCVYCSLWTRKTDQEHCPFCGHELLSIPIGDN